MSYWALTNHPEKGVLPSLRESEYTISQCTTTERIVELRNAAKQHVEQAKASTRYEEYFSLRQKARRLVDQADQLQLGLQGGEA
ncbi:hypothetical protein ACH50O_11765 [Methylomonas sp. 2BW1-5-20]|uniref:hypothetical protein n=1 Tax=Methylomonas sp. 2BW1-5-20 TaxID=3376686 RepID=UPI004051766A